MGNTITSKEYKAILEGIIDDLPKDKILEIIDFANFLLIQYVKSNNSPVDSPSLLVQQKTLARIWDDSEEDIYDLLTW